MHVRGSLYGFIGACSSLRTRLHKYTRVDRRPASTKSVASQHDRCSGRPQITAVPLRAALFGLSIGLGMQLKDCRQPPLRAVMRMMLKIITTSRPLTSLARLSIHHYRIGSSF